MAGLILAIGALGFGSPSVPAQEQADRPTIVMFWGDGCPHCAAAEVLLDDLTARYPGVVVHAYEVWYDRDNALLFGEMARARGFEPTAVPTILAGDRHWVGYSDAVGAQIEATIATLAGVAGSGDPPTTDGARDAIDLPLIGTVDLAAQSLLIATLIIAFIDGFNPCSLWVLGILVALALHAGSRAKVLIIGSVFITVTAAIYALFIAGLFTVLTVASFAGWVQIVVALVAAFFGAVNVKDYFFFREGLSLTIDDRHKPGIIRRARQAILVERSTWSLVLATVVLAAGVSLVEFSCTAGFPVLWTNFLTDQQVSIAVFLGLLLVYLVIYQLDEFAIFLTAVVTLRAGRIDERHGRLLKLVGGVLMLTLAIVMIVDSSLLGRIGSSLAVFGAAFAATGLILLVHRLILPRFGIRIGSEPPPRARG